MYMGSYWNSIRASYPIMTPEEVFEKFPRQVRQLMKVERVSHPSQLKGEFAMCPPPNKGAAGPYSEEDEEYLAEIDPEDKLDAQPTISVDAPKDLFYYDSYNQLWDCFDDCYIWNL